MREVSITARDGQPLAFLWKKQSMHIVEIADHWRETGRWWDDEDPFDFFLIVAASGSFLLCRDLKTDAWYAKPVQ
jgi:hypothetical protein